MVYAKLGIGAENSGKLVAKVKKDAAQVAEEHHRNIILVDGSPGIGCPVVSSLSGASYVVIVTEPSVSGFHDLKRVIELIQKFRLPAGCIINKRDLNEGISNKIRDFLVAEGVEHLADLPYHNAFSQAIKEGVPVTKLEVPEINDAIHSVWSKINN
jgi:MinD superfamily P-loop ATPase